jgi:hypothetical protein
VNDASLTVSPFVVGFSSKVTLKRAFWIGTTLMALVVAVTARPQYVESALGAVAIMVAALLPMALWIHGKVKGIPLFPVFTITHLWAFGFPLLYEHPIVMRFPAGSQLVAGFSVAGALAIGTFCWVMASQRPVKRVSHCAVLQERNADSLFLLILAGTVFWTIANQSGWLDFSPGIVAIVRAVTLALEALACFVLSFRLGTGRLIGPKGLLFKILITGLVLANLPGLLLVNSMSVAGIAFLGYTLGANRFPWVLTLLVILLFGFLHIGKSAMRLRYWAEDESVIVKPWDYPAFFAEWANVSADEILFGSDPDLDDSQSLLERASLMQLLLYVQSMTPDAVPYLSGATYQIIPSLLVPRLFNEQKIRSHEGTYMLNIHYGFQTQEESQRTTIGFGLLNESFANFGFFGMSGLSALMGFFYAWVSRLARGMPLFSLRSLFAVLVASYAFQTEFASGVYVAALFQSTIALFALAAVVMRSAKVDQSHALLE